VTDDDRRITLGHGAGGRLTLDLVQGLFAPLLANRFLEPLGDAAVCPDPNGRIALTTDSFVVQPLFFAGGDIGSLAINGTVNDLAVAGARPLYLTLGVILEEGLPLADLERVIASIADAATRAGVQVVAGDTKVVERGKGDGIFLNTAGVGVVRSGYPRTDRGPASGDAILVSGPMGDHGAVILAARHGLIPGPGLASDCAPVTSLVDALFAAGIAPLFMRDPTRGGLAGVLADLAEIPGSGVRVEEAAVPIRPAVETVCAITGVDPWHLACEGRVVAVVAAEDAERAIAAWRAIPGGEAAARIGSITAGSRGRVDAGSSGRSDAESNGRADADISGRRGAESPGRVVLVTRYGGARLLLRPSAELLPRIC
jgi:hydrogenase expression/formation protein HypE